jgi:hypothetical protein
MAHCAILARMNQMQLRAKLRKVPNLSEFSRRSGVPLRTLFRLRRKDAPRPLPRTVEAIERALDLGR